MEIITNYQNKEAWDKFIMENSNPASFLQSWEWGEFNKNILNNEIQRWAVIERGWLKIVFTIIKKTLPGNKFYYYCPRGLITKPSYTDKRIKAYTILLKKIKNEIKDIVFIRLVLPSEFKDYMFGFIKRLDFIEPKILTHSKEPDKTLILNLTQTEDELLQTMHHKTRYNIRLAKKKGVTIRIMNNNSKNKDIDIFYKLTQTTSKRDDINVYNKTYYSKLINYFFDNKIKPNLKLYIAEFNKKPLAAIMVFYFGNTATYLHGASDNNRRNLMPNYLLQWQAIKDAKKNGYKIYDFWGINEQNKHWAGITRFKKGFGGQIITFMGSWDYILNKSWYNLFRFLKTIKKLKPF